MATSGRASEEFSMAFVTAPNQAVVYKVPYSRPLPRGWESLSSVLGKNIMKRGREYNGCGEEYDV